MSRRGLARTIAISRPAATRGTAAGWGALAAVVLAILAVLVTVAGTGFVSGQTTIKFGTRKATALSCASWDVANPTAETTCTVTSPAHGAGTVDVRATINKATSSKTSGDRYMYA